MSKVYPVPVPQCQRIVGGVSLGMPGRQRMDSDARTGHATDRKNKLVAKPFVFGIVDIERNVELHLP